MKKLSKLRLNQISKVSLNERQMNVIRGGDPCCGCGCHGPSSTVDNQNANAANGYGSVGGSTYCWCWNGSSWDSVSTK